MTYANEPTALDELAEFASYTTLPEGTTITVEGGLFVLREPTESQPWDEIVMTSPDGTLWTMTVDNTGSWVATSFDALTTEAGTPLATEAGDLLIPE